MRRTTLLRLSAVVAVAALTVPGMAKETTKAAPRYGAFGVDLSAQERTLKPGDDFWTFANGSWDKRTQIPADKASVGYGNILTDEAEVNVRAILDDMAQNPAKYGATGKQVGDFYGTWMDEAGIEAKGTAPLQPYLAKIAAVQNLTDLQTLFASVGYESPVGVGIIPNLADPTRYTATVGQGGLGMPRDYYLLEGAKYDTYRKAYRAYIEKMQTLAGIPNAAAKADAIMALETAMAKEHWSPEKSRDIAALNDPEDVAGLTKKAPEFDWPLMLKTAGVDSSPKVLMANNTAITALGKIMVATPLATWKDYLAYHFVSEQCRVS